mgnify:CR=1 FL=1
MSAFDQAWELLKAPIVEPIPGVKVGYQAGGGLDQSAIMPEQVSLVDEQRKKLGMCPMLQMLSQEWR